MRVVTTSQQLIHVIATTTPDSRPILPVYARTAFLHQAISLPAFVASGEDIETD